MSSDSSTISEASSEEHLTMRASENEEEEEDPEKVRSFVQEKCEFHETQVREIKEMERKKNIIFGFGLLCHVIIIILGKFAFDHFNGPWKFNKEATRFFNNSHFSQDAPPILNYIRKHYLSINGTIDISGMGFLEEPAFIESILSQLDQNDSAESGGIVEIGQPQIWTVPFTILLEKKLKRGLLIDWSMDNKTKIGNLPLDWISANCCLSTSFPERILSHTSTIIDEAGEDISEIDSWKECFPLYSIIRIRAVNMTKIDYLAVNADPTFQNYNGLDFILGFPLDKIPIKLIRIDPKAANGVEELSKVEDHLTEMGYLKISGLPGDYFSYKYSKD